MSAPSTMDPDIAFILECIRCGELNVDMALVDARRGSKAKVPGKSARQSYRNLMTKYNLPNVGNFTVTEPENVGKQPDTEEAGGEGGKKRKAPPASGKGKAAKAIKEDKKVEELKEEIGEH